MQPSYNIIRNNKDIELHCQIPWRSKQQKEQGIIIIFNAELEVGGGMDSPFNSMDLNVTCMSRIACCNEYFLVSPCPKIWGQSRTMEKKLLYSFTLSSFDATNIKYSRFWLFTIVKTSFGKHEEILEELFSHSWIANTSPAIACLILFFHSRCWGLPAKPKLQG